MIVEVSYLLSADELYTLISLSPAISKDGQRFCSEALTGAAICDLSGLVSKKLARYVEDELDVEPVLRLIADTISKADSAERQGENWQISSPRLSLICRSYDFHENHWKITPVQVTQ